MTRQNRIDLLILAALALVMLVTRTHSLSQYVHLPDTSWASFFIAGFYLRQVFAVAILAALAFTIDVVMINLLGVSGFCFTVAYWLLMPAYGVMWLAGRLARERLRLTAAALPMLAVIVAAASFVAELISSGSFYFLGGRFADPTLAGFLPRIGHYFPLTLSSTLMWTALAAAVHALLTRLGTAAETSR